MDEFIIEPCRKENRKTILNGINDYNLSQVPAVSDIWTPLEYVVRSNDGVVIAGILGGIGYWNGLEIKTLWVEKSYRNRGVGSKILKYTEKIAKEKGAHISMVDTFDFQAEDFYLKNGYRPYGELTGFPTESSRRIYFSKKLNE